MRLNLLAVLAGAALFAGNAQAQTEIVWWHSMGGALGEQLNGLASRFNESQKDYKVVPVFKGTYPESMTAAIAAFRAGNAPHILQVFEVGTATMMAAKGAIVPVAKVMTDAKEPFEPKAYLPTVSGYYTDLKGNMLSFPFNSSTVMFYVNKDAFKKAGLDPDRAPRTWKDFQAAAEKLKAAGQQCVYTTSWPSWTHIENFSAWHNVPIGTKQNGTSYVPITLASYELTRKSGFYDKNPGADMPVKELTNKAPTANSKGLRFGNFVQGREVIEEELEAVFAGRKDAKSALDEAVKRGNEILRKFEAAAAR